MRGVKMNQIGRKRPLALTLGTVQLGQQYGIANKIGRPNEEEAINLLTYASLNGVTTFDTSPGYGESEDLLGRLLQKQKNLSKDPPKILTKLPEVKIEETASFKRIHDVVERNLRLSLNKLTLPSLDGYFLHNENNLFSHNGKVIKSLTILKQQGLIKNIGASVYSSEAVRKVLAVGCFDMIQVPINVFDQNLIHSGLLDELSKHQIKIYARSVYLQGLLLLPSNELPEHVKEAKEWIDLLREIASENKIPPYQLAFCFVRDLPQIDSIVVGCETLTQLKQNIEMATIPQIPSYVMLQLMELFKNVPKKVTNPTMWK